MYFFDNDDDDRPLTRSDLRRYRWRYWKVSLVIGLIALGVSLCWMQAQLNHVTQQQQTYYATSTAVDQYVATRESEPLQGVLTIAQTYYTAISNQDYAGAYGYLSSDTTYNGKPISQRDFIQQAKRHDAKDGSVTSFKVHAGASSPDADVQVTRKNGSSYSVTLFCTPISMDMNDAWKISSFNDI